MGDSNNTGRRAMGSPGLALALALMLPLAEPAFGRDESADMGTEVDEHSSPAVEAVWEMEDAYWRYVQQGDVDGYLTLWHEDFIGWPCAFDARHPTGIESIGSWVQRIRDEKLQLTYKLEREAGQDFGPVVAVHYSTPMIYQHPDGRVTGQDTTYKFTHTWLWNGTSWQIISGMCAPLD